MNSRDGDGNKDQENEGIRYRQTDREGVSYRDASHSKNMKGAGKVRVDQVDSDAREKG